MPEASVALHVTVVVPTLKETLLMDVPVPVVAPVMTYEICTPGALSVATGLVKVTGREQVVAPTKVLNVWLAPAVMVGNWLSTTVTVNEVLVTPQLVVAAMETVVVPILKAEPDPVPLPDPEVAPEKL